MQKLFSLYLAIAGAVLLAATTAKALDYDTQLWSMNQINFILSDEFTLLNEVQPRFQDSVGRLGQLLIGSGLNYTLSDNLSIAGGYLWTPKYPRLKSGYSDEHRIWQQVAYRQRVSDSAGILHRFRLENRFIEDQTGVNLRLRYFIAHETPLRTFGEYEVGIALSDEVFINVNSTGPLPGFNLNRLFIGAFARRSSLRAELGYMPEFVNGRSGREDSLNHNIYLLLTKSFDLR